VQVGCAADAADLAGVDQRGADGDQVGGLAAAVHVDDRVEDDRVLGLVEVVGLDDLDDVGDGVLGQQHAAQHALLGGDVLRRRAVELARPGAAGTRRPPLWTGLFRDRHQAPSDATFDPPRSAKHMAVTKMRDARADIKSAC
jgi:hypothetical protein